MAFRYPLQSLLLLRQSLERQEERQLFAIAASVARLGAQVAHLRQDELETKRKALQEMLTGSSGAALLFATVCERATENVRKRLETELEEAECRRLVQLEKYKTARQKREILEGLREHQEAAYELELAHREQQRLDEAFLMRRRDFA